MKLSKICYGTGLGGYGKPTRGLALESLGLQFATMQMARGNNQKSVLWHLGTEGYDVTPSEREKIIAEMTNIADRMGSAMEKLQPLTSNGQRRSPHFAGVLARV